MKKINLAPEDIQDMQLEESICQALSLTGNWVIVKFSSRKTRNDVIFKKKSLNGKSEELKNLGFHQQKYL